MAERQKSNKKERSVRKNWLDTEINIVCRSCARCNIEQVALHTVCYTLRQFRDYKYADEQSLLNSRVVYCHFSENN